MLKTKAGFSAHVLLPVIAVAAALGIGGYAAKHAYDISQERKQFMAAKAEVNKLGETVASQLKSSKVQAVQSCHYGNVKYGKGGLSCRTNYYMLVNSSTQENDEEILSDVSGVIKDLGYRQQAVELNSPPWSIDLISFKTKSINTCAASLYRSGHDTIIIDKNTLPGLPFDIPIGQSVLDIQCQGRAKAEYFPVRKS